MKYKIPIILIYSGLIIGFIIISLSLSEVQNYNLYAIFLFTIGLLTDIFDGIIARRLNISSEKIRKLDSNVDQIFFISVLLATYIKCPFFFEKNVFKLSILIGLEFFCYLICYIKFRKEIAIQIMIQCDSVLLFNCCFWLGLITRFEITAIILILKKWTNDVPTFYHAFKLRQGKEIKRNKFFNG
jgi:phosphatidylglycerophosphate synthase